MKEKNTFQKFSSLSILAISGVKPYKRKKNEEYMNTSQINHFKKILEAWYKKLNKEINQYSINNNKATNFPDPIDRATQEEEFSITLRNRERECKLIKKIENTLQKIQNDNFGYCDSCGIEIGLKRLEARPTANLCIDCKTIAEIRKKQMSG